MRIGELLDALRPARLWLPLAGDGTAAVHGDAVTLPTVTYLGCEFIPAYTSAELLAELAGRDRPGRQPAPVPHIAVNAAGLARLLPPDVGIALNVGAAQSVPVYPQGVAYLAADEPTDARRITVGPLPARAGGVAGLDPGRPGPHPAGPQRVGGLALGSVRRRGHGRLRDAWMTRPMPSSGLGSSSRWSRPPGPAAATPATPST